MSGVQGSGVDLYARARLRFPITVTGTDTLVSAALPSGFISLTDLTSFIFESNGANTGAVTLDIGDGVARQVVASDHRAMHAGDIPSADVIVEVVYDSSVDKFHALIDEGIGKGQTWQDVSASRSVNTTYTNTTGKTIVVCITQQHNASDPTYEVSGVTVGKNISSATYAHMVTLHVPHTKTYRAPSLSNILYWTELR